METNPFNREDFYRDYKAACSEVVDGLQRLQSGVKPDETEIRRLLRVASLYYWLEYKDDLSAKRDLPAAPHAMPFERRYPLVEHWMERYIGVWTHNNNPTAMGMLTTIFKDSSEGVRPRTLANHAMTRFLIWGDDVDPVKKTLREEIAASWCVVAASDSETPEWRAAFLRNLLRNINNHDFDFQMEYVQVARDITMADDITNELFDAACCVLQYYHIVLNGQTPAQRLTGLLDRMKSAPGNNL